MIIEGTTFNIECRWNVEISMIILTFTDFDDRHIFEVIQESPEAAAFIPLIIRLINEF